METRSTTFVVLLVLGLAGACAGDDDGGTDAGPTGDAATDARPGIDTGPCAPGDPRCEPARCPDLVVFDGAPTPDLDVPGYVDGGDVEYVFGFQGGVMVQPVIEVPVDVVGAQPCVEIEVRNAPHPDFPDEGMEVRDFPSFVQRVVLSSDGEVFRSNVLDDQIGWNAPDGLHIQVEIIARGTDWARTTGPLGVRLVDADGFQECDRVRKQNTFGCIQHVVPASYEILELTPGASCTDDATLQLQLEPTADAVAPDMCFARTQTLTVQQGCVDDEGLSVGQTGMLEWRYHAETGNCSGFPDPEVFGLRTAGCCP